MYNESRSEDRRIAGEMRIQSPGRKPGTADGMYSIPDRTSWRRCLHLYGEENDECASLKGKIRVFRLKYPE